MNVEVKHKGEVIKLFVEENRTDKIIEAVKEIIYVPPEEVEIVIKYDNVNCGGAPVSKI